MTHAVAKQIRRIILGQSRRANVGHIGSALSVADILAVLYHDILRIVKPRDPERDRFILSKGHSALALYAALSLKGWLDERELNTFCGEGSRLSVCLLYTSDAADERSSVDLGGRRIIKKKKK